MRRNDCAQVTDGAAAIFLALARLGAENNGPGAATSISESVPRTLGWGHRVSAISCSRDKIAESRDKSHVFPHVRDTIKRRVPPRWRERLAFELDAIETHDCFAITEYMAIDHFGITAPGEAWKAVEDGTIAFGGKLPVNPSGGLIGLGHPGRRHRGAYGARCGEAGHRQRRRLLVSKGEESRRTQHWRHDNDDVLFRGGYLSAINATSASAPSLTPGYCASRRPARIRAAAVAVAAHHQQIGCVVRDVREEIAGSHIQLRHQHGPAVRHRACGARDAAPSARPAVRRRVHSSAARSALRPSLPLRRNGQRIGDGSGGRPPAVPAHRDAVELQPVLCT